MKQLFNILGLAMRARMVDLGTDKVIVGMKKNKYPLVILASDASDATTEKILFIAKKYNTKMIKFATKENLGYAVGKAQAVVIGIPDVGFVSKIIALYEQNKQMKNNE